MEIEVFKNTTAEDFKNYFKYDFKYLINYNEETTYMLNSIVIKDFIFYQSLKNGNYNHLLTDNDWWVELPEEDIKNFIADWQIEKAMFQAQNLINANLFGNNNDKLLMCYLYLTAHFLIVDNSAFQGNGLSNMLKTSQSVDGVSVSYSIPQSILNNPLYSYLAKTEYGLKYLTYIIPLINGYTRVVCGTTSFK